MPPVGWEYEVRAAERRHRRSRFTEQGALYVAAPRLEKDAIFEPSADALGYAYVATSIGRLHAKRGGFCGESGAGCGGESYVREHAAHERSPMSRLFSQLIFDARYILGAIHSKVRLFGLNDDDFKSVLQRPQLFE
jgi:hypothetical protein